MKSRQIAINLECGHSLMFSSSYAPSVGELLFCKNHKDYFQVINHSEPTVFIAACRDCEYKRQAHTLARVVANAERHVRNKHHTVNVVENDKLINTIAIKNDKLF